MNQHTTSAKHSFIVEALSLIEGLLLGHTYGLDPLEQQLKAHWLIKYLTSEPDMLHITGECLLKVTERTDAQLFADNLNRLSLEDGRFCLLGYELNDCEELAASPESFAAYLKNKYTYINDPSTFCDHYLNPKPFLKAFGQVILKVIEDSAFNTLFTDEVMGKITHHYDYLNDRLADQHPLSLSQTLMGKNFYTISDWSHYEFFVCYCKRQYRTHRFMDHESNILILQLDTEPADKIIEPGQLSKKLKSFGDPSRMKILQMIYNRPTTGKDIATALGLTTATVSHHMDTLRKEGLLHEERNGNSKYFSVNRFAFDRLTRDLNNYVRANEKI